MSSLIQMMAHHMCRSIGGKMRLLRSLQDHMCHVLLPQVLQALIQMQCHTILTQLTHLMPLTQCLTPSQRLRRHLPIMIGQLWRNDWFWVHLSSCNVVGHLSEGCWLLHMSAWCSIVQIHIALLSVLCYCHAFVMACLGTIVRQNNFSI